MKITRTSMISGVTRTLDLEISEDEWKSFMNGTLIQYAFPNISASEREFILSGITSEEWNSEFSDNDEFVDELDDEPAF